MRGFSTETRWRGTIIFGVLFGRTWGHVRRVMLFIIMTSIELTLKANDVIGAIFICDSSKGYHPSSP